MIANIHEQLVKLNTPRRYYIDTPRFKQAPIKKEHIKPNIPIKPEPELIELQPIKPEPQPTNTQPMNKLVNSETINKLKGVLENIKMNLDNDEQIPEMNSTRSNSEKVYCNHCKVFIAKSHYKRHLQSKLHLIKVRRSNSIDKMNNRTIIKKLNKN